MKPSKPHTHLTSVDSPLTAGSRRSFLRNTLAAALAAGAVTFPQTVAAHSVQPRGNAAAQRRRARAYRIRHAAALAQKAAPVPKHPDNGDENLYATRISSFSKGLPHNDLGEVIAPAYDAFLHALDSGEPDSFELIPMGCPDPSRRRKLVNPQAGLAFDLEGADSHALAIPPAPAFASAEAAGEIIENYWMALCRDIAFSEYDVHPMTQAAAADLSARADFRGPKVNGQVTTGTLFRGITPGDLVGPYVSQFLLMPVPFGAAYVEQRMRCPVAGVDFLTTYPEWLACQNGCQPERQLNYEPVRRYVSNGRDISQWVHIDVLYQAYFHAMLILLTPPDEGDAHSNGMGAPFNPGNPYKASQTQDGFGTFGPPHIASLMTEVATRALKAVWFQKWFVHRRLRPETFAGRIHNHLIGAAEYPLSSDLATSSVLAALHERAGTTSARALICCRRLFRKARRCTQPMARAMPRSRARASPCSRRFLTRAT